MNSFSGKFGERLKIWLKNYFPTLIVVTLIVIVLCVIVSITRSNRADTLAKLSSQNDSVRSAEVLHLAETNDLADALQGTIDPNSSSTSPQNARSSQTREAAAKDLNSLIAQNKLPPNVAMGNLFLLSKDSDQAVKDTVALGLSMVGKQSDDNLKRLVQRLGDGDPDIRAATATALGKIGGAHTASLVAPMIANPDTQVAAQTALQNIGARSVPYLTPMISGANADLKGVIVATLGNIGNALAVPPVVRQLSSRPSPAMRRIGTIALADIVISSYPAPPPLHATDTAARQAAITPADLHLAQAATPFLVAALNDKTQDSFARTRSAQALGVIGGQQAITALAAALGDFDQHVAHSAQTGIELTGASAVPTLAAVAQSSDESARIAASTALGGIGDGAALVAISRSLSDPSADVRAAAAQSLGFDGDTAAISLLIPLLSDQSGQVAVAASNSLHQIGAQAVPPLVAQLSSGNDTAAFYASQALHEMGNAAVPAVTTALNGGSDTQKVWAAVTLGQIHDPSVRPALERVAASGSPRARWAASQALLQLG